MLTSSLPIMLAVTLGSTLVLSLVLAFITRSSVVTVLGGAFLGVAVRDWFLVEVLHRPVFYHTAPEYVGIMVLCLAVSGLATVIFRCGLAHRPAGDELGRRLSLVCIAACTSAPTIIPWEASARALHGVAPSMTANPIGFYSYCGMVLVAVIGMAVRRPLINGLAAVIALVIALWCLVSERNGQFFIDMGVLFAIVGFICILVDDRRHRKLPSR